MILSVIYHELAEAELLEAAGYYESVVSGLGLAFLEEVERATERIRNHPEAAPLILKVVRRKLLCRFPYSIMYSVVDDEIRILALASQKRRPLYRRGRR